MHTEITDNLMHIAVFTFIHSIQGTNKIIIIMKCWSIFFAFVR